MENLKVVALLQVRLPSSVPEVLVARHAGLRVMMISMVSNVSYPLSAIRETSIAEVIAVARAAEPNLRLLIRELLLEEKIKDE